MAYVVGRLLWSTWGCPRRVRTWPLREGRPRARGVEAQAATASQESQAPAAPLGYHEHALDLGVAVPVALGVPVLGPPAAGRHRAVLLVVGEQVQAARRKEHRGVERCDIALGDSANEYGGLVECEVHLDGLVMTPTVEFDGTPVVVDGRHVYWTDG